MGNLPQLKASSTFPKSSKKSTLQSQIYTNLERSLTSNEGSPKKRRSIEINLESLLVKNANKITEKKEITFIVSALSSHPLFKYIEGDQIKNTWIKKFYQFTIGKKGIIYKKNSITENAYIVYKGKVTLNYKEEEQSKEIFKDLYDEFEEQKKKSDISIKEINKKEEQPQVLKEGDHFGEFEVVNKLNRRSTASSIEGAVVFAIPGDILREILKFARRKNKEKILSFIQEYFPFIESNEEVIKIINESLTIWNFKTPKTPLIYSECIYIIYSGNVGINYQKKNISTLRKGDIIGYRELIIPNCITNIQLETITECEVFTISFFSIFSTLKFYSDQVSFFAFCLCFNRSEKLNIIDHSILSKIFPLFTLHDYSPDEVVFEKGEGLLGEIIVILEGNILERKNERKYEAIRNEIYHEKELICKSNSIFTMENKHAFPECTLLRCNGDKIKGVLNGHTLQEVLISSNKKKMINNMLNNCHCYNFPKIKLTELEKNTQLEKYESGITIITQGSKDLSKIYLIKSGYVSFYSNNKYVRTLGDNSPFGFRALMMNSPTRTATAITSSACELYAINAKVFFTLVINDNQQSLNFFKNKIGLEDDTISLNDFENIRLLGKGSFGFVNLVKSKRNKMLYAIKAIPLKKIMQYNMYEEILTERNTLRNLNHNFIMTYVSSFKNKEFVFLVNEYIKGKTLSKLLKEVGTFSKIQAQFYIASLLIVIEHLHNNNIIHRDIKPENIMINEKGYIKMIDFGTVKEISTKDGTAHTIIGTPKYMAPEVIRGESYNNIVDYWSLGICLYEFIFGKTPFGHEAKDPKDIYKSVLNDQLTFPINVHDKDFINLVSGLLVKDKTKRKYGTDIQLHPWFDNFNWDGLIDMTLQVQSKVVNLDYEDANVKSGNYLYVLKRQLKDKSIKSNNKERELDKYDYEKGEKFLNDF